MSTSVRSAPLLVALVAFALAPPGAAQGDAPRLVTLRAEAAPTLEVGAARLVAHARPATTLTAGPYRLTFTAVGPVAAARGEGAATPAREAGDAVATPEAALSTALPDEVALGAAYPNPLSTSARIPFALPEGARVEIVVFDLLGREVARPADGTWPAGWHHVELRSTALASGTYLYRMETGDVVETRRLTVVR